MFEYIKSFYGILFFEQDLSGFVAMDWLTEQEAKEIAEKQQKSK